MDCPTAPPSLTPESLPPASEHCLGGSAGFATFERLAALDLLNEARFGSLTLRLGRSLGRALSGRIAPIRYRLRYMFNVQFTWQIPFTLLVHSVFHDAPKATKTESFKTLSRFPLGLSLRWLINGGHYFFFELAWALV